MALLTKRIFQGYTWLFDEFADARTNEYWLMTSPIKPILIVSLYIWFVHSLGPAFMKNRPAFKLEKVLIIFNSAQILINGYIFLKGSSFLLQLEGYSCLEVDYSDNPLPKGILSLCYAYFLVKVSDLLDTVFFILRKKKNQISFLHLYHHTLMVLVSWIGVKYFGGGHSVYTGILNTFVHTVMYSYYLITSCNSEYKKNLWWKKYITQLQLLQFILLAVIYVIAIVQPSCKFPKVLTFLGLIQNAHMAYMFAQFYRKAYLTPKSTVTAANVKKEN